MSDEESTPTNGAPVGKYPDEVTTPTKKTETEMECTTLELCVDLPPNTSVEATVKQDLTGDGEADNTQKIVAKDGEHAYQLDQFETGGVQYWTEFTFKTDGAEDPPAIDSFKLSGVE